MDKELIDGVEDMGMMSEINVTPFIDIMLVLLIIFMVTAPLMMGGVQVNLPKSDSSPMAQPKKPLVVSLDAENRIFIDKEEVLEPDRHQQFQQLARTSENGEVFVKGDGAVRYSQMMDLMSSLGQAGFARVTLVTDVRQGVQTPDQAQPDGQPVGEPSAPLTAPVSPPAATPARPAFH